MSSAKPATRRPRRPRRKPAKPLPPRRRVRRFAAPSKGCASAASGACSSAIAPSPSTMSTSPRSAIATSCRWWSIASRPAATIREGGGAAWAVQLPAAETAAPTVVHQFSERFECRTCGITYEDPQPRLFSFNNPFGACPTCHGFGNIIELDMSLVVPDPTRSINEGAIEPWSKPHYRASLAQLKRVARTRDIRLDVPWQELTDAERTFIVKGDDEYDG